MRHETKGGDRMGLRTVLYGYRKEHLSFYTVPEEVEIVRRIFADYISQKPLKAIADELTKEKVVYYEDKTSWTKNAVCRIIDNLHYAGDTEYPAIISKADFETAAAIKSGKGGAREKDTVEIAWLKSKLRCGQCGHRITRIRHYSGAHERWTCVNGCKTDIYVDDPLLYRKLLNILNKVIENPSLLEYGETDEICCEPVLEVLRSERETERMIEQKNPQFLPIKKVVFECAQRKFDCCRLDYSKAVTEALIGYVKGLSAMETLDFELLKKFVTDMTVNKDGGLSVRFLNRRTVSEKEDTDHDDRNAAESCH